MLAHQRFIPILFASSLLAVAAASADELRSTLDDQKAVAVTIYNSNLALVKDQRQIKLQSGNTDLALLDVSAMIRPETALLRNLGNPDSLYTLEQNFDFDLLTPQKLLEKYVGKSVRVARINPATGAETIEKATVLAATGGTVLKIGDRIETGIPGRIIYDDVPANLRDRPTLVTRINSKVAGEQNLELSYLTSGLNWKADFVAELDEKDSALDLSGWVTLTNTSGTSYNHATLQLVAGDVNRVSQYPMAEAAMSMDSVGAVSRERKEMSQESLMEYHLYTLDRPTTIAENQTKQVALLSASGVPVRKELVLRGADYYYYSSYGDLGQKMKVGIFIEFENRESSKLGMPIPKGIIRVYKKDSSGKAQFVGEDHVDHTPKNEMVRLKLGESFDVTADKKQTDFKTVASTVKGTHTYESAYEILLKNAKPEPVTVIVQEPIPADWKMLSESHKSTKATSNTAVWKIEIPAEGKVALNYRVQVRY